MKEFFLFILLGSVLFISCNGNGNTEKVKPLNTQDSTKTEVKTSKKKKEDLTPKEIGADELIIGEWVISEIGGNPPQEDRKEITAVFEKDGKFQRRLSPAHEAEAGNWKIDEHSGKKVLLMIFGTVTETNVLIKLTEKELIFVNSGKSIKLIKK